MRTIRHIFFLFFLFSPICIFSQNNQPKGIIKGRVIDIESKLDLVGAQVFLKERNTGTSTDEKGYFEIKNVPVGSYSLVCNYIGYEKIIKTDIIVRTERETFVNIELQPSSIEVSGSTVTAGYFPEIQTKSLSSINFSSEEIRRAPGALGDVSRVIFGLPSLAKINDTKNSLIVRGGSPVENVFYIDNIEIPNINHFPIQGSTEGPIGILNVDFVEDVEFNCGGFPATYGNALSSTLGIKLREGNRTTTDIQLDMNMSGFGGMIEGPISGGQGSYLLSARRSYLDLILDFMGTTVGTPTYSDIMTKIVYNISDEHKLSLIDVFSDDKQVMDQQDAIDMKNINIYPEYGSYFNTGGISWQWLWGKSGFSETSIAHTYSNTGVKYLQTKDKKLLLDNHSVEQEIKFRNSNHLIISSKNKINFGLDIKYILMDYNQFYNEYQDVLGNKTPVFILNQSLNSLQCGSFIDYTYRLTDQITIRPGARIDYYEYNEETKISPRISLSYNFDEITSLTGSYGIFYQNIPWIIAAQQNSFRKLKTPRADHYVLSFSRLLTESTKLTVELYNKEYMNFPMDPTQPSQFLFDQAVVEGIFLNHANLVSTGKAHSRGIEATVQKKMADGLYGLISGSYYESNYTGLDGRQYNRIYENIYNFAIEGGYKPDEKWEFSLRWLYAGGAPYTPFDEQASKTTHKGVFDVNKINGARYPDFHSLNIRVDKRYYFKSTTLTVYLSLWNAYNRKNIASYTWNEMEDRIVEDTMWGLMPVFGIRYEF
ncbi:MAG: TonB-dependent receptor [Bacteroidetes bacterium]|nr:TonB-dependent receptor [Bacteroidota bacterium]